MKINHQILFKLLILVLLIQGCDFWNFSGLHTGEFLSIQTDKLEYNIHKDEIIKVIIKNNSDNSLHYNTCFPKILEVLNYDGEIIATKGFPVCYCLCLTTLEPGETVPEQITQLDIKTLTYSHPSLKEYRDVLFRLRFEFSLDRQWNNPLPPSFTRSNPFMLKGFNEADSNNE